MRKSYIEGDALITIRFTYESLASEIFTAIHQWVGFPAIASPCAKYRAIGSGINYNKRGLTKLIRLLLSGEVKRLVITNKDRLLRFGAELIFALCEEQGVEVVIINQHTGSPVEQELVSDVLGIITVFSARLYGLRSHQNKALIQELEKSAKKISQTCRLEDQIQV